jgi:mannose-1-phosphate guanylyltransferase
MIIPVIIAGGSGTGLWPLSRKLYPKQLLKLVNDYTFLQNILMQVNNFDSILNPLIICNEEYRFMVAEQLREININSCNIILEPIGRNTAPALAVAALKAMEINSEAILLVLSADHVIENKSEFHNAIQKGHQFATQNNLITFGVIPQSPITGNGYIHKGEAVDDTDQAYYMKRFVEKSHLKTEEEYFESGQLYCNSGIFMFKVSTIIHEYKKYAPAMLEACTKSLTNSTTDIDFLRLDKKNFANSPSDSIDHAIMEKTGIGIVIPFEVGWNDLDSWNDLWNTCTKDQNQNVINGDVLVSEVKNSYLYSKNKLIAAVGIENHVVIETKDAVFVASRNKVKNVKNIINQLKNTHRYEANSHCKIFRPWGNYESIDISDKFKVNRISVKPGAKLSSHKHFHRAEHWIVVSGTAIITKDNQEILLKEDQSTYISMGIVHSVENPGKIPLELIEIQCGRYLVKNDITRFKFKCDKSKQ